MNMIEEVKICFSKYAQFQGRARRAEYWWFALFLVLLGLGLAILDVALFGFTWDEYGPLNTVFSLATLVPSFSVGARRLHDTGRSGWWQLLLLIPLIGVIILIVWFATSGEKGDNRFGSDPL